MEHNFYDSFSRSDLESMMMRRVRITLHDGTEMVANVGTTGFSGTMLSLDQEPWSVEIHKIAAFQVIGLWDKPGPEPGRGRLAIRWTPLDRTGKAGRHDLEFLDQTFIRPPKARDIIVCACGTKWLVDGGMQDPPCSECDGRFEGEKVPPRCPVLSKKQRKRAAKKNASGGSK